MNYYQSMVDYIDAKDRGLKANHPHLPWTDERGLSQYDPRNPIRSYSAEDLTKIAHRTEARAKANLRDFKSTTKSSFQLSKSVSAANITQKVKTDRKNKQILKQIAKVKSRLMADEIDYDPDADKKAEYALKGIQKYLRGKSAKSIETQLLSESRKNIAQSLDYQSESLQKAQVSSLRHVALHSQVMSDRMQKQLEETFVEPLESLSAELRGFDKKSTHYFYEKRWK